MKSTIFSKHDKFIRELKAKMLPENEKKYEKSKYNAISPDGLAEKLKKFFGDIDDD